MSTKAKATQAAKKPRKKHITEGEAVAPIGDILDMLVPKKKGRPSLELDEHMVEKLAAIQCTAEEIAAIMECSEPTLRKKCADAIARGRERGKMGLRRAQWRSAMFGSVQMQIWLGKQHLEQREPERIERYMGGKEAAAAAAESAPSGSAWQSLLPPALQTRQ